MNIKKERLHRCGLSNIDFRTKRDGDSLKVHQPWKIAAPFGTMGYSGYRPDPIQRKTLLKVTENINNQRTLASDIPDAKYYKTAEFYNKNKIPLKTKAFFTNERIAQLDESFKGKEKYTGDSMMIADVLKFRKRKAKKKLHDSDKELRMIKQNMIIKDKNAKNKEAIQETQLVNIDAVVTLEDKVDIKKLKEIRLALRRRYANRTNFRKIYKDWDKSSYGEISLYDAHSMINRLGVPINYNETRALIASSNKRETETLNLEEFMHLIFSDNPALNIDLKNIKYKDEKLFSEGEQTENLKRSMMHNIIEMSKTEDLGFLKEYLRVRIPVLVRHFNEETNNEGVCDFEQLRKVVGRFGIPEKFTKEPVLQAIYNQFEKGDKMDYKKLVDHLLDNKDLNDFFDFKEKYINRLKEKIEQNQNTMQESVKALREEQDAKLKLAEEIAKDIEIHKKKSESRDKWTQGINISQPSTEFINKVFANKSEHFNKHLEIEKEFSAHPSLITDNQRKTRYGANPPHKNTFVLIQAPTDAATYISEKERFSKDRLSELNHLKEKKMLRSLVKIEKRKEVIRKIDENTKMKEYINDEKEIYSLLQRTQKLYKYENINKLRNDLVE